MSDLNCAVIGAGRFGKHYIRLIGDMEGVRLEAVGDKENWREVINKPGIDCMVVATPASTHFAVAQAVLEAGKHVLLEKPMTSTLKEARELEMLVEKHKRVFLVGHQYLYNDYIVCLKEEIDKGALGKLTYFFAENLYPGPVREDIGCFWETATHELAILDYLLDAPKLKSSGGVSSDPDNDGRDDFASAEIIFDNGMTASIVVSWLAPEKIRRFTLVGEKGAAVFDEKKEEQLKFYGLSSWRDSFRDSKAEAPQVNAKEPLRNQLEYFFECVRGGKTPRTGIKHGVRVTEMLDSIYMSLKKI